ncbi:hypothetical protein JTB14_034207 [Gonioctena quinquepunctata]|nr:hypothetical protein JTB14_034207 [Gonioctena quinquepunctata]
MLRPTKMDPDQKMVDEIQIVLQHFPLDVAVPSIDIVFDRTNTPIPRRLEIMEVFKTFRTDVYEVYMKKHEPSCSDDQRQGRSFITPNKKMKQVPRRTNSPPVIPVQNRFSVFQETGKSMETDPLSIQEESTNSEVTNNKTLRPPPLVIREKIHWPRINETLKSNGIKSDENFNTRDGVRMILPTMEMFNKSKDILDQQKIQYHTFNTPTNREIPGDNNNTGTPESSAMDELRDLIIRRPILAGLIQLKISQGATSPSSD